jgi:hypothetical protein
MSSTRTFTVPTARLALAAWIVVAAAALAAQPAIARQRHTTITGSHGRTAERDVSRAKGQVESTTTLPSGKSTSRSVMRSNGQTNATVTGANGRQWRRFTQRSRSGSTSTITAPNGKTETVTVTKDKGQ